MVGAMGVAARAVAAEEPCSAATAAATVAAGRVVERAVALGVAAMAAGMGVGWAVAAELEVRAWSRLTAQERLPARARAAAAMASVASAAAMAYSSRCLACGLSSSAACHRRRFQPAGSGRRVAVAISTMRSQTRRPMRGAALDTRASPEAQSSSCSNRRSCRRRRRPASSSRDPRAWCRASTCGHETRGRAWRSMRGGVALAALVASAWAVRIDLEPDVRCCVFATRCGWWWNPSRRWPTACDDKEQFLNVLATNETAGSNGRGQETTTHERLADRARWYVVADGKPAVACYCNLRGTISVTPTSLLSFLR